MKSYFLILIFIFSGCNYSENKSTTISTETGLLVESSKTSTVAIGDASLTGATSLKSDGTISGTSFNADAFFNDGIISDSISFVSNGSEALAQQILGDNYQIIENNISTTYQSLSTMIEAKYTELKNSLF